jgi:hypothetical protein
MDFHLESSCMNQWQGHNYPIDQNKTPIHTKRLHSDHSSDKSNF